MSAMAPWRFRPVDFAGLLVLPFEAPSSAGQAVTAEREAAAAGGEAAAARREAERCGWLLEHKLLKHLRDWIRLDLA